MLNVCALMGRLTRDPELKRTQSGTPVVSFTIAVDRDFSGDNKQTDFIDVVAWKNTAEFVSRYFTKGRMAVVSGRLQIREWTDKEGGKHRNAEIVADNVYFGDSKKEQSSQSGYSDYAGGYEQYSGAYTAPVTTSDFAEMDDDDGDLPF